MMPPAKTSATIAGLAAALAVAVGFVGAVMYLSVEYTTEKALFGVNEWIVVALGGAVCAALAFWDDLLDIFYRAVRVFGAAMLAALIGLTLYDVGSRGLFNDPVRGSNEVVQFLLGPAIFAGIAMVTFHRSHIVVSIFEPALLRLMPRLYKILIAGFNLIGMVTVTYLVIRFTEFQHLVKQQTETLDFKWWHLGVALTVLSCIGIVFGVKAMWAPRPRPRMGAEQHHAE